MINKKAFTLIGLLMVISIIGVLALIGLRVYDGDQQEETIGYIAYRGKSFWPAFIIHVFINFTLKYFVNY